MNSRIKSLEKALAEYQEENDYLKKKFSSKPLEKFNEIEIISYNCKECNNIFNNENDLNIHIKTEHFSQKYSCPQCGKGFNQKNNLNLHRKGHNGKHELQNKCTICDISFETESQLSNHTMKEHPRNFKTQESQRNETDIDPKSKQYNCMECDHQTTEKYKLRNHIELAHNTSTSPLQFKCRDCA